MKPWPADYVGLPFASRGRDRRGLDCWGLVRLIYLDRLGLNLPSYDGAYLSASDRYEVERLIHEGKSAWSEIPAEEEREHDVVLLRMQGVACHVGVVTQRGWFLHVTKGVETTLERYDSPLWARRVLGFYRHESTS